jgi:hypothetical protein
MKTKTKSAAGAAEKAPKPLRDAVDEYQGIPDCAESPSRWRWVVIVVLFAGWAAFLVYCLLAGRLPAA